MRYVPSLDVYLDGAPGSEGRARSAARCFLGELAGLDRVRLSPQTRQDAVLVVSELVCNACRHAPGPCRLTMVVVDEGVEIAVEDTSSELLHPAGRPGPSGHGLFVVATIGHRVHAARTATGKIVETVVPNHRG
ncbi:ATP-binding protein [Kitasatospora sp. RG8]|uniref:ATP-binding protein n=1 Tax=Kitasatospora sp. RG8 TaxID=2820815 RepID=UPI001ADF2E32|nr:ATP-binding protein [Kitasatospora sp. RG8]MBP0450629.1 ATP-binding protein [Kitasatospora sp. RG8]